MSFIQPMNAAGLPGQKKSPLEILPDEWVAEEKFDGHRLIVEVTSEGVTAWSRAGNVRQLPDHLIEELFEFPEGLFDGELVVGGDRSRSSAVVELTKIHSLVYKMFDVLRIHTCDLTENADYPYKRRREILEDIHKSKTGKFVYLATAWKLRDMDHAKLLAQQVWNRGGEGLILKRRMGLYVPGKRSKDFRKMKALQSAVLTVMGFIESHGGIQYRGAYAIVQLIDEDGNRTRVKTKNDLQCRLFEAREEILGNHPDIGRKLRIEFQERTPDGSYREPRWDRWEDE
jgi:ATP-dependent DNA ligase